MGPLVECLPRMYKILGRILIGEHIEQSLETAQTSSIPFAAGHGLLLPLGPVSLPDSQMGSEKQNYKDLH